MIRLEELLYSLTTVIIRYHDNLMGKKLIDAKDIPDARLKSRALAIKIIQNQDDPLYFSTRLKEIITTCTTGYPDRRPFLSYILNEIVLIKSFLSKSEAFSEEEFADYKNQIFKLLIDIKGLLSTKKSGSYEVTQHQTDIAPGGKIALSGCINERYVGDYFCNSGIFLREEVLETLNISYAFPNELYDEFAYRICSEHQNALLVPELLAKNRRLEEENTCLRQISDQSALKEEEIQSSSAQQTALIKQHEETIRQLLETIEQQKAQIQTQEEKIEEQSKTLAEPLLRPRPFFGAFGYSPALFALGRFPRVLDNPDSSTPSAPSPGVIE
ncbi:hypothetical protein ELY21_11155 [Legionella sp. km535]|uniref:hypothetical protein n=1 Tax=Legionella sp. km535 TaxID=2498107 RepID=UPI000F8D9191|nr:hypothetical protein [Legionella sp. km535]RUR17270.1 hypothetical protein ELY21_11155 [Legionella sp. km535]